MHNNIINYSGVISIRTAQKSGNLYLRVWTPDLGPIFITDKKSFLLACKAAGGWQGKNLVYVSKEGDWQDLQFRGTYDIDLHIRIDSKGQAFGSIITCDKQSVIGQIKVPEGIEQVAEPEPEAKPTPAPASKRRPAF